MAIETRAYDNEHGDPVVVMVITGTFDVSRIVNLHSGGGARCEDVRIAQDLRKQVRRHNAGRAALRLLAEHGGPDFTEEPDPAQAEIEALREAVAEERRIANRRVQDVHDELHRVIDSLRARRVEELANADRKAMVLAEASAMWEAACVGERATVDRVKALSDEWARTAATMQPSEGDLALFLTELNGELALALDNSADEPQDGAA